MSRHQLLAVLIFLGCAHSPSEQIPFIEIPALETPRARVRLEVTDARIQDLFPRNRPELLMATDVVALVRNRISYELARGQIAVTDDAPVTLKVEVLDYWAEYRRIAFMEYRTTATIRLQFSFGTQSWMATGASTQPAKAVDPIPVAVDHLEQALDRCIGIADAKGVFRAINVTEVR